MSLSPLAPSPSGCSSFAADELPVKIVRVSPQISYLPILTLILAFLVPFALILLWRATRTQKPSADGAVCGQCGYSVRGALTFTCPECGSDLREVGIVADRRKPWKSAGPFLAALV